MVFQTLKLFTRARGPDEFWRKRKIFRLTAHVRGRDRNCYSNAIRAAHRSLQLSTKSRDPKRKLIKEIWSHRIEAGCAEHDMNFQGLKEGLSRCEIHLSHKSLAELAVWEPRTFKSLVKIACARIKQDGLNLINNSIKPVGVITRGMIK